MLQQFYPQPQSHNFNYELNKDMNFSAAHYLPDPQTGKCHNIHGHTYWVNITVAGDFLDSEGLLVNFSKLKEMVHGRYDHRILNSFDDFALSEVDETPTPSTEVVARTIYSNIENYLTSLPNKPICLQVLVRETPTSYVSYRPDSAYVETRKDAMND